MVDVLVLVDEKLSQRRYDRLEIYIRSNMEENEQLTFERKYSANYRTYLRVACRKSVCSKLKKAIDNAPSAPTHFLWENVNLQCNLKETEGKMYFNAFIDSNSGDDKMVKQNLQEQNRNIKIHLWVFLYAIRAKQHFRLIFSVPKSDLEVIVKNHPKTFPLSEFKPDATNVFGSDWPSPTPSTSYTNQPKKRRRDEFSDEVSDSQTQAKYLATNSPSTSAAHQTRPTRIVNRVECLENSTSSGQDQPREQIRGEDNKLSLGDSISNILRDSAAAAATLILQEIKNRLQD